jgi:hypothetical protein
MADDAVLSVRTTFDGSTLVSGMKESSTAVQVGSSQMSEALQGVVGANQELAAAINNIVSIRTSERAASAASTAASHEEAVARRLLAAETREATHAAHLFGMETGVEIPRALRGVLAHSSMVGPALAKMFPMLAAVGFADIIVKSAKEAYEWGKQGREAAEKISEGFAGLSRKESEANDQIEVTNAKLQQQIDKLEKKPNNGLALALAETAVQADKLADHLRSALEVSAKLLKEQEVGSVKGAFLGLATTGPAGDLVKQLQEEQAKAEGQRTWSLSQASNIADPKARQDATLKAQQEYQNTQIEIAKRGRDEAKRLADQAEKDQKEEEEAAAARLAESQERLGTAGSHQGSRDYAARITAFRGVQGVMGASLFGMQDSQTTTGKEGRLGKDEQQKERASQANEEQRKASEATIHQAEDELAKLRQTHLLTVFDEEEFWLSRLEKAKAGSQAYLEFEKRVGALSQSALKEQKEELDKLNKLIGYDQPGANGKNVHIQGSIEKGNDEDNAKRAKSEENGLKSVTDNTLAWIKAAREGVDINQKNADAQAEANIQADLAFGRVTALGAAQREAALHTAEYNRELKELQDRLSQIANDKNLRPDEKKLQTQQTQNKIDQLNGQQAVTGQKDQKAVAQQLAAPYQEAAALITKSLDSGVNEWIKGTKTFSNAMRDAWRGMAMGAIENIERIGEKQLQTEILSLAKHQTTEAALASRFPQ